MFLSLQIWISGAAVSIYRRDATRRHLMNISAFFLRQCVRFFKILGDSHTSWLQINLLINDSEWMSNEWYKSIQVR